VVTVMLLKTYIMQHNTLLQVTSNSLKVVAAELFQSSIIRPMSNLTKFLIRSTRFSFLEVVLISKENSGKLLNTCTKKFLDANNRGDYFPIIGHCLGFELESALVSNNPNILAKCLAENISMHLNLTAAAFNSVWFEKMSKEIYENLATRNICLNNHQFGITPEIFKKTPALNQFFNVLSTNYDVNGKEFVSTWEGLEYPMFGIQWHAEKPLFEWNPNEDINHTPEAIYSMAYFAQFLVDQARRNHHHYKNYTVEYNSLIYAYNPVYSEASDPDFEQVYIFN